VGWDNGETIAEDSLFAIKARRKLGSDLFGWHGGVVEEKSPHNLRDTMRQRKRWFYGLIQNLKYLCLKDKIIQIIRALIWSLGFVSGIISLLSLFIFQEIPFFLRIFFLFASILWLLSYQIGAYLNSAYLSRSRRLKFHLATLLFSPIISLLECSFPILAMLQKPKTFEVIDK
jgi:cellulose synthase/poly-beta-1,6-N-acetylglucosamine synthase-like glycosyltransferase